ncbi:hypothetical protein FHS96_005607 [Sphingomonas zeicaulis]|uniref:hypothetical protein n=1 Tax=Sphingomonas zeicaulis TaxID=1632740 RepID=UPI003D1BC01E
MRNKAAPFQPLIVGNISALNKRTAGIRNAKAAQRGKRLSAIFLILRMGIAHNGNIHRVEFAWFAAAKCLTAIVV